ncbi:hypothetical protein DEU56DRAFT_815897 [Suillus clintonianus]|uniref:uncharacterized protein n=1 Tax=Suillus clintonianus TaxID=1904413 RepID=UPI001B87A49D|nr:uncharacterized protein DEU56DRAFT_815897 [Suillus clintonianus]KAG2130229.1 hypothetical protein DEU56DRAFT_815897 [Suillus clintonianus]
MYYSYTSGHIPCHLRGVETCLPGLLAVRLYGDFNEQKYNDLITDSNTVGTIASVASIDWGCAVQVMAAVSIGSGQTFTATSAQTLCVIQDTEPVNQPAHYVEYLAQSMLQ